MQCKYSLCLEENRVHCVLSEGHELDHLGHDKENHGRLVVFRGMIA